jgi:hypothetical protein
LTHIREGSEKAEENSPRKGLLTRTPTFDLLQTITTHLCRCLEKIVKARCTGLGGSGIMPPTKYWEIVGGKLSAAGWL